ncbi:hypothetical protein [Prauserella flavalba]|uniref:Uncharacterized protein n=1 Tax=Prauserella flavalba TaxID=1477506 RepID=A0A318LRQ7_9PSEU|nr:hypothetical protein [Prauserella flavalba]PXY37307.1 hypothetical protein BA062_06090 [Prauserella flavalba]
MAEAVNDPHVHVGKDVVHGDAAARNLLASTFGLVGELPNTVTTGCGSTVPYAMTSPRPESVTCLPCREYARARHLRLAEQVEGLARMPGSPVTAAQAHEAATRHRDLANRFGRLT